VDLTLEKSTLTLKHDNKCNIQVTVSPEGAPIDAYRIEIKRASGGDWCTLSNSPALNPWKAPIAGKFKIRGVAKICGTEKPSAEKDLTVQFPSYAEIISDAAVKDATDKEWTNTLNDCTEVPNRRRERGFWVRLNTQTDKYEFTAVVESAWSGPADGASVDLPPRPADAPVAPSPCDAGATYSVASFHTHTPTTFRTGPGLDGAVRGVGPSAADNRADATDDVPGLVYDYEASPAGSGSIPMKHPKESAAHLYESLGKDRRTTPP
jgi:hypothetical protein